LEKLDKTGLGEEDALKIKNSVPCPWDLMERTFSSDNSLRPEPLLDSGAPVDTSVFESDVTNQMSLKEELCLLCTERELAEKRCSVRSWEKIESIERENNFDWVQTSHNLLHSEGRALITKGKKSPSALGVHHSSLLVRKDFCVLFPNNQSLRLPFAIRICKFAMIRICFPAAVSNSQFLMPRRTGDAQSKMKTIMELLKLASRASSVSVAVAKFFFNLK
jgi:hypothetical protein